MAAASFTGATGFRTSSVARGQRSGETWRTRWPRGGRRDGRRRAGFGGGNGALVSGRRRHRDNGGRRRHLAPGRGRSRFDDKGGLRLTNDRRRFLATEPELAERETNRGDDDDDCRPCRNRAHSTRLGSRGRDSRGDRRRFRRLRLRRRNLHRGLDDRRRRWFLYLNGRSHWCRCRGRPGAGTAELEQRPGHCNLHAGAVGGAVAACREQRPLGDHDFGSRTTAFRTGPTATFGTGATASGIATALVFRAMNETPADTANTDRPRRPVHRNSRSAPLGRRCRGGRQEHPGSAHQQALARQPSTLWPPRPAATMQPEPGAIRLAQGRQSALRVSDRSPRAR